MIQYNEKGSVLKPHEINKLAIWLPMKTEELSVKAFSTGYPYIENGIIMRSDLGKPVFRYAKNYKQGKKKFSLCFITHEADLKKVEAFMDEEAENIEAKSIVPKFQMLERSYA